MCHYTAPLTREAAQATGSYGNVAVLTLIGKMRDRAPRASLEAQVFGGAARRSGDDVGSRNIDIARRILHARGVRIVSEDVGGSKGRKVLFDSQSGHSAVLKVHEIRKEDWGE
jgi:chemotaxis protein CheD